MEEEEDEEVEEEEEVIGYKRNDGHFRVLGLQTLSLQDWRQRVSCGGS